MSFIFLQRERVLRRYPGVVYEFDLIGGYGYAVLMRKYNAATVLHDYLLLVLPGLYRKRPQQLERIFRPLLMQDSHPYFMMFFPVDLGLKRGLFRAMGIVRNIEKWFVPEIPTEDDERKAPWYWSSQEREWTYMPTNRSNFDIYCVSSVAILQMLKGLRLASFQEVEPKRQPFSQVSKRK